MKRIVIQFACTAKEKRAIQREAKRRGKTVSQLLRLAAKTEIAAHYEEAQGLTR